LLEGVKKQLGTVPNMFRLISNSPASLESYLGLSDTLNKGAPPAQTRERIALAVAEINGCNYCLSAHTYLGKNLAKLDDAEINANRNGASNDLKADAAVRFAVKVVRAHGHVTEDDITASKPPAMTMRSSSKLCFMSRSIPGQITLMKSPRPTSTSPSSPPARRADGPRA
jgi:AhpD family alkylhydroperoxidase